MSGRGLAFGLVTAVLMLLLAEAAARLALGLLESHSHLRFTPVAQQLADQREKLVALFEARDTLLRIHPVLGWEYGPEVHSGKYSSNAQGLRGTRDYTPAPAPGVLRVAAFGDSYVHGNEVADDEAWSARLEAMDPRVEVLNYGVGGYGVDQALLLFRDRGLGAAPHVVMLGFAEVDYARSLNRYRRFLSPDEIPLFKPRFKLDPQGGLELVPNPFPGREAMARLLDEPRAILRAARDDWFFEPLVWRNPLYDRVALVRLSATLASRAWRSSLRPDRLYRDGCMNPESEGFRVLVGLVREFQREVRDSGRQLLFVVFPGRDSDIWGDGPRAYAPLLEALEDTWTLDLADALSADPAIGPASLRAPGRHYSPNGNLAVARAVHAALLERNLIAEATPAARLAQWPGGDGREGQARPAVRRSNPAEG